MSNLLQRILKYVEQERHIAFSLDRRSWLSKLLWYYKSLVHPIQDDWQTWSISHWRRCQYSLSYSWQYFPGKVNITVVATSKQSSACPNDASKQQDVNWKDTVVKGLLVEVCTYEIPSFPWWETEPKRLASSFFLKMLNWLKLLLTQTFCFEQITVLYIHPFLSQHLGLHWVYGSVGKDLPSCARP